MDNSPSFKVREGLQRSIDESRMLSISVLAEQSSMLEEMDLAGLAFDEEDVEQEEWTVPELDLVDLDLDLDLDEAVKAKEAAERKLLAMESKMKLLLLNSSREADSQISSACTKREDVKGNRSSRVRRTRSVGGLSLKGKEREGRKATSLPVQVGF